MTRVVDLDSSFDPFRPDSLAAPYALCGRLREIGPVPNLPSRKVYLATTHEAVDAVLRDFRTFSSASGAGYPICSASVGSGIQTDEGVVRGADSYPATRRDADEIRDGPIRRLADAPGPDPVEAPFIGTDPPRHTNNPAHRPLVPA